MAALSPEQVAQYAYQAGFRGDALTEIVAIAGRESGYNPTAYNGDTSTGDNSVGLTQINLLGSLLPARGQILQQLGYNVDPNNAAQVRQALENPLTNLQVAYVLSSNGTQFNPWGGYKGQSPTYATDLPAAAQAVQAAGYDPGTVASSSGQHFSGAAGDAVQISDNSGSGSGGSTSLTTLLNAWYALLNAPPDPSKYDPTTGLSNDGSGSDYDSDYAAWQAKVSSYGDFVKAYEDANPIASPTDPLTQQINAFNAQLSAFNAKEAVSNDAITAANANVNRFLGGQAESRARAEDQEKAQEFLSQWGAPQGKTAFTSGDLGLMLGANSSKPFLNYTGQTYINPAATLAANDAALGVQGQVPMIPSPTVSADQVPTPPIYNPSMAATGAPITISPPPVDSEGNSPTLGAPEKQAGSWMNPTIGAQLTDPNAWWQPGNQPNTNVPSILGAPSTPGQSTLTGPNPSNSPFLPGYVPQSAGSAVPSIYSSPNVETLPMMLPAGYQQPTSVPLPPPLPNYMLGTPSSIAQI